MSATGRNLEGNERHARDFYETPAWCTDAILRVIGLNPPTPMMILDAGAGSGAIMKRCKLAFPYCEVLGCDIEPQDPCVERLDFFTFPQSSRNRSTFSSFSTRWGLVIANPPYSKALEFVKHAITLGNEVAFLLRLNWLASRARADFHRKHPSDVYILPRRPSFTGGGTDATEYAWFVWGKGRGNRWQILDVGP